MANRTSRTPKKEAEFFEALRAGESIKAACKIAGFGRRSAYEWRAADAAFAQAWDEAVDEGTDELEDVAVQRAKDGSDTLLIFMLKARRPEKFKDRSVKEVTGANGGPVQIADITRLKGMTAEELKILERALVQIGLAEGDTSGTGEPED